MVRLLTHVGIYMGVQNTLSQLSRFGITPGRGAIVIAAVLWVRSSVGSRIHGGDWSFVWLHQGTGFLDFSTYFFITLSL